LKEKEQQFIKDKLQLCIYVNRRVIYRHVNVQLDR